MTAGTALSEPAGADRVAAGRRRPVALEPGWGAVVLVAVCALGAALRFYRLGHQGFWYDEANTAQLVHFSLGRMLGEIPQSESTPPLYYLLAWGWARVFGFGEAGVRSLSALAGVLTIPVAFGAGAKLVSRRAGLIVAALCACNPFLIWYSQEARSYALLVLMCGLATLAFAYVLEEPAPRRTRMWALACALALATHYYAVVVVAPQAAWLLFHYGRRRPVRIAVAAVMACGLVLVPLAVHQNSTGRDSWIAHSPLGIRLGQIIPQFLIGTDAPARVALKFAAFALAAVALALLVPVRGRGRRRALAAGGDGWTRPGGDGWTRRRALLAGDLALAGFILSLLFVAGGKDTLITRNIIGLWLPAAIAVAGGLALARPRLLGALVAAALCGIGVTAAIGVATTYDFQRPDWRLVARLLGPRPAAGTDRVILIQHYKTLLPLSLYLPGLQFLRSQTAHRVSELDVIAMSSPQQPLCWWGAACNLLPSQVQSAYAIPGFRELWRRRARRFTVVRLVALGGEATVTAASVAPALSTTTLHNDELLVQR